MILFSLIKYTVLVDRLNDGNERDETDVVQTRVRAAKRRAC